MGRTVAPIAARTEAQRAKGGLTGVDVIHRNVVHPPGRVEASALVPDEHVVRVLHQRSVRRRIQGGEHHAEAAGDGGRRVLADEKQPMEQADGRLPMPALVERRSWSALLMGAEAGP